MLRSMTEHRYYIENCSINGTCWVICMFYVTNLGKALNNIISYEIQYADHKQVLMTYRTAKGPSELNFQCNYVKILQIVSHNKVWTRLRI